MDSENISRLRAEMNAITQNFLAEFTPKLEKLFDRELSSVYLNSMNKHLQAFYSDVLAELKKKEQAVCGRIEELSEEVQDLKRKLNADLDFDLKRSEDMPLEVYQHQLDSHLDEMRKNYSLKMSQIEKCLEVQKELCEELNEGLRELPIDPLASDSEIYDFENYLLDLKREKARRQNEIECLQHEIHAICEEMGLDSSNLNYNSIVPSKANIQFLQSERDRLQNEKVEIKNECQRLLQKLEVLWDCLDAPDSIRLKHRNIAADLKFSSVTDLNRELKICKSAKQKNLKNFIEKMRIKLVELWDKIYKSQDERDKFEFLHSDSYTEDLLQLHEMEIEECTNFYNDNKHIFELFNSRNQWWEKKKALEAKQNEPNRYNNRGCQLLKEERERKQTDTEIPKIERRIKTFAEEFRRQNSRDFLINGQCIIQLMDEDWETYKSSKELLKSARKAIATPGKSVITPKTPLRGQVTLKRMASTTNLGMTTGNLAKKRHLENPLREINRTASVQKSATTSSYLVRSHTKRNLLNQYNDENILSFAKPNCKTTHRMISTNKKQGTLANISASKILKKYRLSSCRRSLHKGTISDESLANYDAFENNIKNSQISNSSVVEQNNQRDKISKSTKINNHRGKSPLKPSNLGTLQINNVVDLV